MGLFLLVDFFGSGSVANLLDASRIGLFVGAWVQFLAVIIALAAGVVVAVSNYRTMRA